MTEIDWERRRRNLRIMMAAQGTNPTRLAREAELAANTVSQFTNGAKGYLSEATLARILPLLELTGPSDLDTDNPLTDPKIQIKRLIDAVPEDKLQQLLDNLRTMIPATPPE